MILLPDPCPLPTDATAARLVRRWEVTPDRVKRQGELWYPSAADIAAEFWPSEPARAAAIIAALSPRAPWQTNLLWANAVITAARSGQDMPAVSTETNRMKAWRIAGGERPLDVLGGDKVRAFYWNIRGNTRRVTVDVWAARAAGWTPSPTAKSKTFGPTHRQYVGFANAYRTAARYVGTEPSTLQATLWIMERGDHS